MASPVRKLKATTKPPALVKSDGQHMLADLIDRAGALQQQEREARKQYDKLRTEIRAELERRGLREGHGEDFQALLESMVRREVDVPALSQLIRPELFWSLAEVGVGRAEAALPKEIAAQVIRDRAPVVVLSISKRATN